MLNYIKSKTHEIKKEKDSEKKSNIDQFIKGSKIKSNNDSISN